MVTTIPQLEKKYVIKPCVFAKFLKFTGIGQNCCQLDDVDQFEYPEA
jgi:hypothetical protein